MIVEQGDVIVCDFDPTVGHEPRKRRPAVVVSVGYFNNVLSSLVAVCPITSRVNGHPLHVPVEDSSLSVSGCVCLEQLRTIDFEAPSRRAAPTGERMDVATMTRVLDGLGAMLGI